MSRILVSIATTKEVETAMGMQVMPAEKLYEYRNATVDTILEKFLIIKCHVSDVRTAPKDVYIPLSPLALLEVHYDDDAVEKLKTDVLIDNGTPKRKPNAKTEKEVIIDG